MSQILNRYGDVASDNLIYDNSHPIDAKNITLAVNGGETTDTGAVAKGQIIDFDAKTGTYGVHAKDGTPAAIAAEDITFAADDKAVVLTVYTTGAFFENKVIADPALTAADIDALQKNGIFLK